MHKSKSRSAAASQRRYERFEERVQKLGRGPNDVIILAQDEDLFFKRPGGHEDTRVKLEAACPNFRAEMHTYRRLSEDHDIVVEVDPSLSAHTEEWSTTRLLFRVDRGGYDLSQKPRLDTAFARLFDVNPRHARSQTPEEVRSGVALSSHYGFWWRSAAQPHLSSEARLHVKHPGKKKDEPGTQVDPEAIHAIDHVLAELNEIVGVQARNVLLHQCRHVGEMRDKILEQTWAHPALKRYIEARPALKCVAWHCVAIKEGSAEIDHIDLHDDMEQFTIIATAGNYTGGDIVIPQLRIRIPLRPGQLLFLRTRYLAHFVMPYEGIRYVMAGFMDSNICKKFRPDDVTAPKHTVEPGSFSHEYDMLEEGEIA